MTSSKKVLIGTLAAVVLVVLGVGIATLVILVQKKAAALRVGDGSRGGRRDGVYGDELAAVGGAGGAGGALGSCPPCACPAPGPPAPGPPAPTPGSCPTAVPFPGAGYTVPTPTPPQGGCAQAFEASKMAAPSYDLLLTWYGVQTDYVVSVDMYQRNFALLLGYLQKSVLPYTGVFLHVDNPVAGVPVQGKPNNYSTEPYMMAQLIMQLPSHLRVGMHLTLEQDATWDISPQTIMPAPWPAGAPGPAAGPASPPGWFPSGGPGTQLSPYDPLVFYGGAGAAAAASSVSPVSGAPYQTPFPAGGAGAPTSCPDKPPGTGGAGTGGWGPGCPGNASRAAWYMCEVNAYLKQLSASASPPVSPPRQITMLNYDSEGNGADGAACTAFQFLWAVNQFSNDLKALAASDQKLSFYLNGSTGMTANVANDAACRQWRQVPIPGAPAGATFGSVADFRAAPEFYWMDVTTQTGASCTNVTYSDLGGPGTQLIPAWRDPAGLNLQYNCAQSSINEPATYDANCGCRKTVYEAYGSQGDAQGLLTALTPFYDSVKANIPFVTPAFSLEHLGAPDNSLNFGECLNSINFCPNTADTLVDRKPNANYACMVDDKCTARCGVMNCMGSFKDEACFGLFLNLFAAKYGAKSIMIYEAGFIPPTWAAPPTGLVPAAGGPASSLAAVGATPTWGSASVPMGGPMAGAGARWASPSVSLAASADLVPIFTPMLQSACGNKPPPTSCAEVQAFMPGLYCSETCAPRT
jgi:hypothetical protein